MKFNEILTNHGFENGNTPLPLWKLQLTSEEYTELKQELRDAFKGFQLFKVAKEAALYYANWWCKEYVGGVPSTEKIAADMGIHPNQSDDLYTWAKRGLSQLRISPVFRNGRYQYFRTLLLQGGLPAKSLKEGNNKTNYGAFFEGLIKYTNEINIDYEDISFINYLPCTNRLASSFRTTDFYELNLMIIEDFREKGEQSDYWDLIQAIFDREDDRGNIQRIKKLITEKKEKTTTKMGLFSVDWHLQKYESNVSLLYTLSIPQKIKQTDISSELQNKYELSIYSDNKEIAKYNRSLPDNQGNVYFVKIKGKDELTEKLLDNSNVVIRLSNDGCFQELSYSAPNFADPILLRGFETVWNIKRKQQDEDNNAVLLLHDSEWIFIENPSTETVTYNDQKASWIETDEIIKLQNKITNEVIVFDNLPFLYHYETHQLPDIKSKNRKLINSATKFRAIYTIGNELITKDFYVFFRTKQSTWAKYIDSSSLPTGLLYFKFIYPDNKVEYVSFFNIGNLSVFYSEQTTNSGIIRINNWTWLIQPISGQNAIENIEHLSENKWKIIRNTAIRHYSIEILFRINDQQNSFADIILSAPFQGIVITDISGNIVDNEVVIALHSLWQFKCLVLGSEQIIISIFHNRNKQNKRTFKYNLNKKQDIPFSDIEESIKNLFTLFGTDHTDYDSFVTIKVGDNYSIFVRPFNVNVLREEWNENKIVKLDGNNDFNRLLAMKSDCEYPDEIDIIEFSKKGNEFVLPEVTEETNGVIVFSDDISPKARVRPTFLPIFPKQTPIEERKNSIREELTNGNFNAYIWDNTVVYFHLLISNNLPFKTLDVFRIIAESPLLCTKLAFVLLDHQNDITPEERKNGLLKFENEFALAWHWIDYATWKQAVDWAKAQDEDVAVYYIRELLKDSLTNNSEKIIYLYKLFSTDHIERDTNINDQQYIHSYTPYVDIQSEDWLIKSENNRIVYPKINKTWQDLFKTEYGSAVRTFLNGPVKAALSAMGQDNDQEGNKLLWLPENETQRRIMFYYWKLNPEAYTELFLEMVKKINYRLNHNKNI